MEHIGRKEIFFLILCLFLFGSPVFAENGKEPEEDNETAYQLQLMKTLIKCLELNDQLYLKHKSIQLETRTALVVFRNNMKLNDFNKVRDRSEAYLDHTEELLNINREIIRNLADCSTREELRDAIHLIAHNQTVILLAFNDLCVLTDVAAGHMAEAIRISRKTIGKRFYFDFL